MGPVQAARLHPPLLGESGLGRRVRGDLARSCCMEIVDLFGPLLTRQGKETDGYESSRMVGGH